MNDLDPQNPTPALLRIAYAQGVFPMSDPDAGTVGWYSPDPRGILPLEDFHVPRSLGRVVRRRRFEIRTDTAFAAVMRACAAPRPTEDGTWIDERLVAAYAALHDEGAAHSIEAWLDDRLVGGLYGVHLGAAFFGESMFVRPARGGRDASKVCLVELVRHLRKCGFTLLDTQFWNEHLDQFGCVEVPRADYLRRLKAALDRDAVWGEPGVLVSGSEEADHA